MSDLDFSDHRLEKLVPPSKIHEIINNGMKVKDLIKCLSEFDQELYVTYECSLPFSHDFFNVYRKDIKAVETEEYIYNRGRTTKVLSLYKVENLEYHD
jgi:hypothetical protein